MKSLILCNQPTNNNNNNNNAMHAACCVAGVAVSTALLLPGMKSITFSGDAEEGEAPKTYNVTRPTANRRAPAPSAIRRQVSRRNNPTGQLDSKFSEQQKVRAGESMGMGWMDGWIINIVVCWLLGVVNRYSIDKAQ